MSSLQNFCTLVSGFALTYLLHSTVILSICWIATRVVNRQSHEFHSRAWKCATLLGIATASIALMSRATMGVQVGWSLTESRPDIRRTEHANKPPVVEPPTGNGSDLIVVHSSVSIPIGTQVPKAQVEIETKAIPMPPAISNHQLEIVQDAPETVADRHFDTPRLNTFDVFAGIVLAMGALGLIRLTIQWNNFRRMLTACRPSSGRVNRVLKRIRGRCTICRDVRVLVCDSQTQPFAAGLFRWKIVLPIGLEAKLRDDQLYALLMHEFGHLQRSDIVWQWIGELVCTCLAIQPLNFIARRQWQLTSEFLADRWSCEQGGASPMALAKCLTVVAEWSCKSRKNSPLSCGFAVSSGNELIARVDRLVQWSAATATSSGRGWRPKLVVGATFIAICTISGFAPNCIPNGASATVVEISREQSEVLRQWAATGIELRSLRTELDQLTQKLTTQQSSPIVKQIVQNLERRANSMRERQNLVDMEIHKQEAE